MKKLVIIFYTLLLTGNTYAVDQLQMIKTNIRDFSSLLTEMHKLRLNIKADDVIKTLELELKDEINEVLTHEYSNSISSNQSFNYDFNGEAFGIPSINWSENSSSLNHTSFQLSSFEMNEQKKIKNQKELLIKKKEIREFLRTHLKENMDKIVSLKLMHAYGLSMVTSGQWDLSVDELILLEKLGSHVYFYGNLDITYCVETHYAEKNFQNEFLSNGDSNLSMGYLNPTNGEMNPFASLVSSYFIKKVTSLKTEERTSEKCTFQSKEQELSEGFDENTLKYDLIMMDKFIKEMSSEAYSIVLFSMKNLKHDYTFGNTSLDRSCGEHPFDLVECE